MKRTLLLAIFCVTFIPNNSRAEIPKCNVKYQGEVLAGYSLSVSDEVDEAQDADYYNRLLLHTIHGVNIKGKWFVGLGIGFEMPSYFFSDKIGGGEHHPYPIIPLFINSKRYISITNAFSLFAAVDLGYSFNSGGSIKGTGGFFVTPSIGASIKLTKGGARINLSVGYNYQNWSGVTYEGEDYKGERYSVKIPTNDGAVTFKVGFQF